MSDERPAPRPTLHVCITCRKVDAIPADDGASTPGKQLFEALSSRAAAMGEDAPAHVLPTACFAACERGCVASLSAPGKWAYLAGGLDLGHADDLLAYAVAYRTSTTGVVLRSGRPESLHQAIIARFPAPASPKDAAE